MSCLVAKLISVLGLECCGPKWPAHVTGCWLLHKPVVGMSCMTSNRTLNRFWTELLSPVLALSSRSSSSSAILFDSRWFLFTILSRSWHYHPLLASAECWLDLCLFCLAGSASAGQHTRVAAPTSAHSTRQRRWLAAPAAYRDVTLELCTYHSSARTSAGHADAGACRARGAVDR